MSSFQNLFNEHNISTDSLETNNLIVTGTIDLSGATIAGFPVDDTTIEINDGVLAVKASGINTIQLANGSVHTTKIENKAVTNGKLADDSVSTIKLENKSVTTEKLADLNVTDDKIVSVNSSKVIGPIFNDINNEIIITEDLSVNGDALVVGTLDVKNITSENITAIDTIDAKNITVENITIENATLPDLISVDNLIVSGSLDVSGDLVSFPVDNSTINISFDDELQVKDFGITEEKLDDLCVSTSKLKNDSVTGAKLGAYSVSEININWDAVTTQKIMDDTITSSKLVTNCITSAKIINNAVTSEKIIYDAITTAKILDSNVTSPKLATNSVSTLKILDSNVTTSKIADSAVTSIKISNDAIIPSKIPDGSITSQKLGSTIFIPTFIADTIDTKDLKSLSITANTLDIKNTISVNSLSVAGNTTVTGNIIVGGTVDSVDVSSFKSDYDFKVNQDVRTTASPSFNNLSLTSTTDSSSLITGSFKTDGGAGIAKNVNIGGNVTIAGSTVTQGVITANITNNPNTPAGSLLSLTTPGGYPGLIITRGSNKRWDFSNAGSSSANDFFISSKDANNTNSSIKMRLGFGSADTSHRGSFLPDVDNSYQLGNSAQRWSSLSATSGLFSSSASVINTSPGVTSLFTVGHTSNTPNSDSNIILRTAGTSAGDPYITYQTLVGSNFSTGIDNSDSDKFKISNSIVLGTNDALSIDTSQVVSLNKDFGTVDDLPFSGCRGWVKFDGSSSSDLSGHFVKNDFFTAEVTVTAHNLSVGNKVYINILGGGVTSDIYEVKTVTNANTFTISNDQKLTGEGFLTLPGRTIISQKNVNFISYVTTGKYIVNFKKIMPDINYNTNITSNYNVASNRYDVFSGILSTDPGCVQVYTGFGSFSYFNSSNVNVAILR